MFSQFGKIVDVVCLKTYRLRGQAWVVFSDVAAATNALRTMQGFPFFDKPIVSSIAYHTWQPAHVLEVSASCNGYQYPYQGASKYLVMLVTYEMHV